MGVRITILRDNILVCCEFEIINTFMKTHKVSCDRDVRGDPLQDGFLLIEAIQPRVRGEARPVQFLSRVGLSRRTAGWMNLLPISIDLTPECRTPCEVKFIERTITFLQPIAKSSSGVIAKT